MTGNGKSRHAPAPAPASAASDSDAYHFPNGTPAVSQTPTPQTQTQPPIIIKQTSIDANMNEEPMPSPLSPLTLNKQVTKSMGSLSKLFGRRKRRHRNGSISASFSVNDSVAFDHELVNVNTATVEELMTLKGVNRTLAGNIINHRALIGGFRKVEDLALVSGMGANKLGLIRNEICVRKRTANGNGSLSKSPSLKSATGSIESRETATATRPTTRLNINNCTIFELMSVPGVNQALAARIVSHRERKGVGYKSVEELRSVCSSKRLSTMKGWITVNGDGAPAASATDSKCHSRQSSSSFGEFTRRGAVLETNISTSVPQTPKSPINSQSLNNSNRPTTTEDGLNDIFELMSIKSPRPFIADPFQGTHDGTSAYRLAVWDMEGLSLDKVRNPGVLEVVVRTVLENGFSLLLLQHVLDDSAPLKIICDELNGPRLQRVREFKSEWTRGRGTWRYSNDAAALAGIGAGTCVGMLYNDAEVEHVDVPATTEPSSSRSFKVKTKNGHVYLLMPREYSPEDDSIIEDVLFINADSGAGPETKLQQGTGTSAMFNALNGMTKYVTGSQGRVTQGLTHLAIPKGWNWGGRVTKSEPVWITLYNEPSTSPSQNQSPKPSPCEVS